MEAASAPIERNCRTTPLLTLPNTSERAILLTVPMLGADGTAYGLCGFSVNQTYFSLPPRSALRRQPTGLRPVGQCGGLDISKGLLAYPANGFCFVPDELLTENCSRKG